MPSKINYVENLPTVNTSENFIIIEELQDYITEDWRSFISVLVGYAKRKDEDFVHLSSTLFKNGNQDIDIFNLPVLASTMLGTGGHFKVIEAYDTLCSVEDIPQAHKTYEDFIEIYENMVNTIAHKNNKYETVIKSVVDKFLAYQWQKGRLLYPMYVGSGKHHRHKSWHIFANGNEISREFQQWVEVDDRNNNQAKIRKNNLNILLTSTKWKKTHKIQEADLMAVQKRIIENKSALKIGKYLRVVNDFRLFLISKGNTKIKSPIEVIKTLKKPFKKDKNGNLIEFFDFVDTETYPNLSSLVDSANSYSKRLSADGLGVSSIKLGMNMAKKFLLYLIEYYPTSKINIQLIEEIFHPDTPDNILDVMSQNHKNGRDSAIPILHAIAKFLVHAELHSPKVKKYIPVQRKKTGLEPYRSAMSVEMVRHILDILKNRPPKSNTKWSKTKVDSSWWGKDEYPIFPLMLLFHYYIPLRGNQVRHLCRSASFIMKNGTLDKIIVNTDKNVNRKFLQEIPCVWDDLQIFVPFLKWHKEYFPNIQKIQYQDDNNSPWEDIEPLFVLPQTLKPISNITHFTYHKKVLCQYQLEVEQQARERGDTNFPTVAWSKTGKPFFTSIEELNQANTHRMRDIEVSYDIHSLRVTGATRYLESGVGYATVMMLTGHISVETLTQIYIRLTRKEMEVKLSSAVANIYFGEKEDLIENTSNFIKGELTPAYELGKDSLEASIADNKLFSLHRKASFNETEGSKKLELGTDIAIDKHPISWIPMIHGICPAVKCPEGRENKCSLCPYLITGKLFMNGVVHRFNRAFVDFQRNSLILEEESKKNYVNHSLAEGLETQLEELLGWKEILNKIDRTLQDNDEDSTNSNEIVALDKSAFEPKSVDTTLAYLKNAYDAELIGVEQDRYALKALTIKAIQMVIKEGKTKQIEEILEDETKAIDMLMQHYTATQKVDYHKADNFIESIKTLPKK